MSAVIKKDGKQMALIDSAEEDVSDELRALHTPELVIALCGPIGSPLHEVSSSIEELLTTKFGYAKVETIRLSEFISTYARKMNKSVPIGGVDRFKELIKLGNEMRDAHGKEILAKLAIKKIANTRASLADLTPARDDGEKITPLKAATRPVRVAHIIDSIKNQSELEILRLVYGDLLYTIGVYAPVALREATLKKVMTDVQVSELIDRDSGEELENGQTVRQTFPFSDYFLRIESRTSSEIEQRVERFLTLVLASKPLTPTVHEMAMYAAASAAGHSACLSRQVGAAVTSRTGELLATGWNDVPKYGGGLYISEGDTKNDLRCWNRDGGKCFNDEEKDGLAQRVAKILLDEGLVDRAKSDQVTRSLRNSSGLKDLIEFSRAIHAEMHAILRGLQLGGEQIKGGRIYVTTYPCHSCARHIIAAGISDVFFIEPYRKSLAVKLHDDAMSEDEAEQGKVILQQYDGVAPRRFLALFKVNADRKKDG
jgi:deoxycytidylate deaminase